MLRCPLSVYLVILMWDSFHIIGQEVPHWHCLAVLATQLGTPRGRYDEHSGKFPLV
jgi:hypothetical protein